MSEAKIQIPECPHGAKLIPLTKGKFAIVDEEDYDRINQHKWYCSKGYACRTIWNHGENRFNIYMHCEIMKAADGFEIDHRDSRAVLDNRKSNLRQATHQQNMYNTRLRKDNSLGVKGVWWSERDGRFYSQITANGRRLSLGGYLHIEEAAGIRITAALEFHGGFAGLG